MSYNRKQWEKTNKTSRQNQQRDKIRHNKERKIVKQQLKKAA